MIRTLFKNSGVKFKYHFIVVAFLEHGLKQLAVLFCWISVDSMHSF